VKATTAKFTAEELITKREEVRDAIKGLLTEKLAGTGLKVEQLSIINFDFSTSFNNAIEAKVTAEQNALAAKNKLDQVKYEAQQAIEEARGKASALQIEAQAINTNPQIIQLRAIEKWDGKLPQVTSGATPFININK
jgi:regulator of protease activity HflC (stomatin/prohibitin superfamily)